MSSSAHSSLACCCCLGISLCCPRLFSFRLMSTFCGSSGCWLMFWMSSFSYSPLASFSNSTLLNYLAYSSQSSPMSLHNSTRKRRHSMLSGYYWQMAWYIFKAFWKLPILRWQEATISFHLTSFGLIWLARYRQKQAFSQRHCFTQQIPNQTLVSRFMGSRRQDYRQQCRACCSSSSRKKMFPTLASTPASLGSLVRMIWYHLRACLVLPIISLMLAIWKIVSGMEIMVWIFYSACKAYINRFNFLFTKPKLYSASMQSASTPIASRYSSFALRKSFFMKRQLPLLTSALALYLSLFKAISTQRYASGQLFSRKQRKDMLEATLLIVVLSFFSNPFSVQIARSISFFLRKAIALKISTSDSTQGQELVFSFSRIHSQLSMTSFSMTGAMSFAERMMSLISSFLLAFSSSFSLSLLTMPFSFSSSSWSSSSAGEVIMLVKQSFILILSSLAQRQMIRLQAVLWSGEPLRVCSQWVMASLYWPSLTQA